MSSLPSSQRAGGRAARQVRRRPARAGCRATARWSCLPRSGTPARRAATAAGRCPRCSRRRRSIPGFGADPHRQLAGPQLGQRRQQAQQRGVSCRRSLVLLDAAEQLRHLEGQRERRLELGLHVGQRLRVQRLLDQRTAERLPPRGVVARQAIARAMLATAQTAFQVRVTLSIGAIWRTPWASSPSGHAGMPSRWISAVGSSRVPSLSLRRSMTRSGCAARRPSSRRRTAPARRCRRRRLRGARASAPSRRRRPT